VISCTVIQINPNSPWKLPFWFAVAHVIACSLTDLFRKGANKLGSVSFGLVGWVRFILVGDCGDRHGGVVCNYREVAWGLYAVAEKLAKGLRGGFVSPHLKVTMADIENIGLPQTALEKEHGMVRDLLAMDICAYDSPEGSAKTFMKLARKYKHMPSKDALGKIYRAHLAANPGDHNEVLYRLLMRKAVRSVSGIINVSVSLPPDKFSCKYNCYFCPNEPGMPRSYLSNEDVFKRALEVEFDTVRQVYSRLEVLEKNGHPIDKIEFRVLGGTFSCYSKEIADTFIRDLYYAANTFYEGRDKERGSILEEQAKNVGAKVHVVGLGVETRPDEITLEEIVRFRLYGITRVELGVQHTDDTLLQKVNRGHGIAESKKAIRLLKDYGFKVEIHIMTDLPGATPEGDKDCYRLVLRDDPDLIPDYMKDYPCLDVSFTKIRKWKEQGKWKPYAEKDSGASELMDVLIYRQKITPPWVRVNRVQRDFQAEIENEGVLGFKSGSIRTNLAQLVKDAAEKQGIYCQCIRCSEIRHEKFRVEEIQYQELSFLASGAKEYFLRAYVKREKRDMLLGFLRLRLGTVGYGGEDGDCVMPELVGRTAMIRELHVYGSVRIVGTGVAHGSAQHLGIGKQLLLMAEIIALKEGYDQMAIISGIGVRDYYRKRGYTLRGTYMMKDLFALDESNLMSRILIISVLLAFLIAMVRFFV
jgi:ELP3 family radical SAM enzyme/protein acetyltransferase